MGATGTGEARFHTLYFEPGGRIGSHPAGPSQLFMVVEGSGWVEGGDGARRDLRAGEAVLIESGEAHAKGSESGMTAVMLQVGTLEAGR